MDIVLGKIKRNNITKMEVLKEEEESTINE